MGVVDDGLVQWRKALVRRVCVFLDRIAQVLIEPAVRGAPSLRVRLLQPLAEPLAHQQMGVLFRRLAVMLEIAGGRIGWPNHIAGMGWLKTKKSPVGKPGAGEVISCQARMCGIDALVFVQRLDDLIKAQPGMGLSLG
jgi:hypothetical protein